MKCKKSEANVEDGKKVYVYVWRIRRLKFMLSSNFGGTSLLLPIKSSIDARLRVSRFNFSVP